MIQPLVSICIPTYNGALYLQEALDSIKVQSYGNLEIIVSDDASTDETLNILDDFKNETNYPIIIHHHEPSGIGANWNNCMAYVNGDYIKFLFQDDTLHPECIEEMVKILDQNPSIGLVVSKRHIIVEGADNVFSIKDWMHLYDDLQKKLNLNFQPISILDKSFFKSSLFYKSPINIVGEPSAVMFRKSLIDEIGFFRTDLKQLLDCEYWYRILKHCSIGIINKKLISFRIHPNQATQKNGLDKAKDSKLFNKILYDDYFWLVNNHRKKVLFLKFHYLGRLFNKFL